MRNDGVNNMQEAFRRFACATSAALGSAWAFWLAVLLVAAWAITGPYFHYSDGWQLVINTSTTIGTFLMVFLLQNTQIRETKAVNVKLDELLRAIDGARTGLVNVDIFRMKRSIAFAGNFSDSGAPRDSPPSRRALPNSRDVTAPGPRKRAWQPSPPRLAAVGRSTPTHKSVDVEGAPARSRADSFAALDGAPSPPSAPRPGGSRTRRRRHVGRERLVTDLGFVRRRTDSASGGEDDERSGGRLDGDRFASDWFVSDRRGSGIREGIVASDDAIFALPSVLQRNARLAGVRPCRRAPSMTPGSPTER